MSRSRQERRLFLAALAGGAPAVALALVLLARGDGSGGLRAAAGAAWSGRGCSAPAWCGSGSRLAAHGDQPAGGSARG